MKAPHHGGEALFYCHAVRMEDLQLESAIAAEVERLGFVWIDGTADFFSDPVFERHIYFVRGGILDGRHPGPGGEGRSKKEDKSRGCNLDRHKQSFHYSSDSISDYSPRNMPQ